MPWENPHSLLNVAEIALNKANFKFSHANVQFTMNEFEFVKAEGHSKQQKVKSRNKET